MSSTTIADAARSGDASTLNALVAELGPMAIADEMTRLDRNETALVFRLLPRASAMDVFEELDTPQQQQVLEGLRGDRVVQLLEELDPDDRAQLLDEMPAKVANRLLQSLSHDERGLTTLLLGYPDESAGRLMTPEFVSLREHMTVAEALAKIRREGIDAETVYALPVLDDERHLLGVTGLRALVTAEPTRSVGELMTRDVYSVHTDDDREVAARLVREAGLIALPVLDSEDRLVGVVTVDDAMSVLEQEETEDLALHGGHSPLRGSYLAVPALALARARALWLLVLIIAAALTVNVLQFFEGTLESVVALALFIPLLIDTGGNSGAQSATAVIRAMAVGEVRFSDLPRILWREARVGVLLGAMLALAVFVPVALLWEPRLAMVVSLTLVTICTWATVAGAALPLLARRVGVDPAVVSAPVITTLVDATGLVIYFLFAAAVLGV